MLVLLVRLPAMTCEVRRMSATAAVVVVVVVPSVYSLIQSSLAACSSMIRAASAWRTFSSRFSTFRMIWRSWSVRFSSICMSWTEPVVAADISRPATWLPYVVLLLLVCISASGLELLPLLPTPLPPTPPAPFACGVGGNRARPLAIL
uniref:(northern house mosquito) hypothetical protein n=1 Tax=Culex pipiens TaxID=7175 RepID=A0A8D8BMJ4_CULPI